MQRTPRSTLEVEVEGCRSPAPDRLLVLLLLVLLLLVLAACGDGRAAPAPPPPRPYACGTSIAPDAAEGGAEVERSWRDWKRRYLVARGAPTGLLRVTMGREGDDRSTSESTAYGMLLAAYLGDRPTFDALLGYARRYRNERGLMAWDISPAGEVLDRDAAIDADEDIAFALMVADGRWGGYADEARAVADSIMAHGVEHGTWIVKPGDVWGGSAVTNPSYLAPAYYRAFAALTGDPRWLRVRDASYALLDRVVARHSPATGLQPDWVSARGDSAAGGTSPADDGFEFHFGYGAARVPWRLAMDAAWNCDERALAHLRRMNRFFARVGPDELKDGYRLDGAPLGDWRSGAFAGPVAAAAVVSDDPAYRRAAWDAAVSLRSQGYYHDTVRLLGLLLASGRMGGRWIED